MRGALTLPLCLAVLALGACGGGGPQPGTDPAADLAAMQAGRLSQPGEPYWPYRLAALAAAGGQAAAAHAQLDTALGLDGDYAPAVALRAKLLYGQGHYQEGVDLLGDHLRRHPEADDALRAAFALHLDAIGAWEESDAVLAACDEGSPAVIGVRTFLGLRGEDPRAAAAAAERALAADPESAVNLNNHGIALLYAGQPAAAKEAFLAALARDADLPGALYNLAIVDTWYFYDEEAGRRWFARYRELSSDDPDDLAATLGTAVATAAREGQR